MQRISRAGAVVCVGMLLAAGCAQQKGGEQAMSAADSTTAPMAASDAPAPALASRVGESSDPRRRFVQTADARFEVTDVVKTASALEDAAIAAGGFVTLSTINNAVVGHDTRHLADGRLLQLDRYRTQGHVVVRLPSERTQAFLRDIAKHMAFLDHRAYQADDVQFALLRARLAAEAATTSRADVAKAATDTDAATADKLDAAAMRNDLQQTAQDAELRQRELEDRIAFSTLTLDLYQAERIRTSTRQDLDAVARQAGPGFFTRIGLALKAGWRGFLDLLVWGVQLWPLWLVVAGVVGLVRGWRRWRRRAP